MSKNGVLLGVSAFVVLILGAGIAIAQQAGFQAAVAQPRLAPPAPQPPAIAVRSTFHMIPTIPPAPPAPLVPSLVPVPLVPLIPHVPVAPGGFWPHHRHLIPGPPIIPGVIVSPSPVVPVPSPGGFGTPFGVGGRRLPPFGTPRAEVLRLLGSPLVTVFTSAGETLHFTGGVTVIIQNGQVVGPR
jgi:hypothetical protein